MLRVVVDIVGRVALVVLEEVLVVVVVVLVMSVVVGMVMVVIVVAVEVGYSAFRLRLMCLFLLTVCFVEYCIIVARNQQDVCYITSPCLFGSITIVHRNNEGSPLARFNHEYVF